MAHLVRHIRSNQHVSRQCFPSACNGETIANYFNSYFKYPFYDISTSSYAEEYKNAFGIAEFFTLTDGQFDASGFTGAALVSHPFASLISAHFLHGIG